MNSRFRRVAFAASLVVLATILPAGVSAGPGEPPVSPALCDARPNDTFKKLLECMTVEGVREHQAALQEIADDDNDPGVRDRRVRSIGRLAVEVLEDAGYAVTRQSFDFVRFEVLSPTILTQVAPAPATDLPNIIMSYSGSGDVTGTVSSPNPVTGCFAADWPGTRPRKHRAHPARRIDRPGHVHIRPESRERDRRGGGRCRDLQQRRR